MFQEAEENKKKISVSVRYIVNIHREEHIASNR